MNYPERVIRILKVKGSVIEGNAYLPTQNQILTAKNHIEKILKPYDDSKVTTSYVRDVLIAENYFRGKVHYKTKTSVIDDIINGKKIYINSYI